MAIFGCFLGAIGLGFFLARLEVGVFGDGWATVAIGMGIFFAGLGLRFWAIFTLGRFFMHTVAIQADHRVVRTGPYRVLRHPSYTGALLIFLGLGISLQNWPSLLTMVVLPLVGVLIRIKAEDDALAAALGDDYIEYATQTRRLIPGVW